METQEIMRLWRRREDICGNKRKGYRLRKKRLKEQAQRTGSKNRLKEQA